ncbi:DsbA family protein [Gemmata sp.]|uniref:DsbA family protein n=1 Tax=Gemmata sp. TaxID=1914242 RepID=UPI003F6EAED7
MTPMAAVIPDVICPRCWIGKRRLEKAVAAVAGKHDVVVRCHPFQLNPHMPPRGDRAAGVPDRQVRKPGAVARTRRQAGGGRGRRGHHLRLRQDRADAEPLDAHRLIRLAGVAVGDEVVPAAHVVLATALWPAQEPIRAALPGHPWFAPMLSLETPSAVTLQLELDGPALPADRTNFSPTAA